METNPIQHSSRELSRSQFQMAGKICVLLTRSQQLRKTLNAVECATPRYANGFELTVQVHRTIRQHSPGTAHFRGLNHIVFALFGEEVFVFDLKRRQVHATVSRETARNQQFWTRTLLPIALGTLGLAIGVVPLHCACLDWNGSGVLITGVSGAGKSTLAVALAKTGPRLVSDDWTYLCDGEGGLEAHGVGAPVKLLPDAIKYFPELHDLETQLSFNGEMAYEIDAADVPKIKSAARSTPKVVLLLHRVKSGGVKIQRCSGETVRAYFERSGERMPPELSELQNLRSLAIGKVAALPCYTIECGAGPHAAANAISEWWKEQQ